MIFLRERKLIPLCAAAIIQPCCKNCAVPASS